jgi:Uma2 family endonuclease
MTDPARKLSSTFPEYVAEEQVSGSKHEHLDGQIHAMAGGSPEHGLIAINVGAELRNKLLGRPCRVFSSDVRIRVRATGLATYPDISVVCGRVERDPEDQNTIVNPIVLVEVLSPSTEAYDRGEKFAHYRRIPSLREYVLVSQAKRRVEVFRRNEDPSWTLYEVQGSSSVELASVGCELALDELYRGVFEEQGGAMA